MPGNSRVDTKGCSELGTRDFRCNLREQSWILKLKLWEELGYLWSPARDLQGGEFPFTLEGIQSYTG